MKYRISGSQFVLLSTIRPLTPLFYINDQWVRREWYGDILVNKKTVKALLNRDLVALDKPQPGQPPIARITAKGIDAIIQYLA